MKPFTFVLIAALAAAAFPALAGNPHSTGLTHTEKVAHDARSTLTVQPPAAACLPKAAAAASGLVGIKTVSVRSGTLEATYGSPEQAAQGRDQLHAAVAAACA